MPTKKIKSKRFKNTILSPEVLSVRDISMNKKSGLNNAKKTRTKQKKEDAVVYKKPAFKLVEFQDVPKKTKRKNSSKKSITTSMTKEKTILDTSNQLTSEAETLSYSSLMTSYLSDYQEVSTQVIQSWFKIFKF